MTPIEAQVEALEHEQGNLDIPILGMGEIVLIVCDRFLINDPVRFFNEVNQNIVPPEFKIAGQLISDFLDSALETSLQIPEIARYLEIDRQISILAEV